MDSKLVLMIVFLASMAAGLGLLLSVLIQQRKVLNQEKKETGYYSYKYFNIIGYLVGAPFSVLLNILLMPKWVFDEPYNPFLTAIPIIIPMFLCGKLFTYIFRKKIRPLTSKEKTNDLIGLVFMLVLAIYVVGMFALHQ